MSADNYHYVGKIGNGRFGVWTNCSASDEDGPRGKPRETFDTAEAAILAAHRYEREEWTEYGVALGKGVLDATLPSPRFVVTGFYCATDANPETDAEPVKTAVVCSSLHEARVWVQDFFLDGEIVPVRP